MELFDAFDAERHDVSLAAFGACVPIVPPVLSQTALNLDGGTFLEFLVALLSGVTKDGYVHENGVTVHPLAVLLEPVGVCDTKVTNGGPVCCEL